MKPDEQGLKVPSTSKKKKAHIKRTQRLPKRLAPNNIQIHCSLELAFDPGDFARDRPKIITRVFDQSVGRSVGENRAGEVELDDGQAWGGGGFDRRESPRDED